MLVMSRIWGLVEGGLSERMSIRDWCACLMCPSRVCQSFGWSVSWVSVGVSLMSWLCHVAVLC